MTTPQRAVVLLSGGLDSSVLLHHVVRQLAVAEVHALSFDYGQRHAVELECARAQAALVGAYQAVIPLQFLGPMLAPGSTLLAAGAPVPDLKELSEVQLTQPPTYVPHRNLMLLSLAAAYAEANKIADVYYGAQAQDEYGYWDCTTDFLGRINAVLSLNRDTPVRIHAPFVSHDKAANVLLGQELGVDFALTWTCYRGEPGHPCATCPACVERLNAFAKAGIPDPLDYPAPA
jgi:7-cyano-7-deazaguanine synthase